MWNTVNLVWNGLLDVLYPPVCLVCRARLEAGALCEVCIGEVHPIPGPYCDRCGIPISGGLLLCESCEGGAEPPFAWSQAAGRYRGRLRHAIQRFKYDGKSALGEPLGLLLSRSLDASGSPLLTSANGKPLAFDAVVPVPLHPSRLRQRGYNQAELLARVVAREHGWQCDPYGLRRDRRTHVQAKMKNRMQRIANVEGAFVARAPDWFHGQSVLIVDDVMTTASTLGSCAQAVRESGAIRVCIVALARG